MTNNCYNLKKKILKVCLLKYINTPFLKFIPKVLAVRAFWSIPLEGKKI